MSDKSQNADVRELQIRLEHILDMVKKVDEKLSYTNGKIAQSIKDIAEIKTRSVSDMELIHATFATKTELNEVADKETQKELSKETKKTDKFESFKWTLLGTIIGAVILYFVTWILKNAHS